MKGTENMKKSEIIGGILFGTGIIGILAIFGNWIFKLDFVFGLMYIFLLMCIIGAVILSTDEYYAG
jgi:hypothetical protein